uniref:Uncharacterized protein n=1 Tax=Rhizophora mucronata TaxID=61149 RepID=A0A2P2NVK7_RHIMU
MDSSCQSSPGKLYKLF